MVPCPRESRRIFALIQRTKEDQSNLFTASLPELGSMMKWSPPPQARTPRLRQIIITSIAAAAVGIWATLPRWWRRRRMTAIDWWVWGRSRHQSIRREGSWRDAQYCRVTAEAIFKASSNNLFSMNSERRTFDSRSSRGPTARSCRLNPTTTITSSLSLSTLHCSPRSLLVSSDQLKSTAAATSSLHSRERWRTDK